MEVFFEQETVRAAIDLIGHGVRGSRDILVVGGVVREHVLAASLDATPLVRDLDILILRDFDREHLIHTLGRASCTENTFGGIKWLTSSGLEVDIWSAPSQALLLGKQAQKMMAPHEVLRILDFTINAGFYSPATGAVDIERIEEAVRLRRELTGRLKPYSAGSNTSP